MNAVIRSIPTTYERSGRRGSPKILVVHGWGDTAAGWKEFQERLAETSDVLIPDLPGFGATPAPDKAWDLNDYAEFLADFVRELRFKPDIVIGHSFGGAVAIRGLADNIVLARKLVLLDSAGLRSSYRGHTRSLRALTRAGKVASYALPKTVRKRLRHAVYRTLGPDVSVDAELRETFKRIVTDDVQSSAARLKLPTLLIYGQDDEDTPVQYGRIFHHLIDSSKLEIIPEAGHYVHLDQPDIVLKKLSDFIGG